MISRRRGAGTTVSSPVTMGGHQAFVTSRAGMLSFVRHTRIRHPVTNSVVVDRELAALTGLPTGTEWFCVKGPRVIRESDLPPICWSELYLRADLPYRDMLLTAKFDIANLVRQRIEQEVSATRLAGAVSEALDVESGSAALVVVHRYFDRVTFSRRSGSTSIRRIAIASQRRSARSSPPTDVPRTSPGVRSPVGKATRRYFDPGY